MKQGDLVKFFRSNLNGQVWCIGLVIDYFKWEDFTRILHRGELLGLPAQYVEVLYEEGVIELE